MEKSGKIALFIIVGLSVINFIISLFGNSSISNIRNELKQARDNADSALNELKNARSKLDSIKSDMFALKSFVGNIQTTVASDDSTRNVRDKNITAKINTVKARQAQIKKQIDTTTVSNPFDVRDL